MKLAFLRPFPALALCFALTQPSVFAQDNAAKDAAKPAEQEPAKEKLPTVEQIIDRFIKELGGKEAFLKLKSQHARGTIEMPAQQIKGKLELWAAEPDKMLLKMDIGGIGEVTTGYNGKVAWMVNPLTGPMLLEGKMKEQFATQADFDHILHDPKDYKSMELLGIVTFEGEECYKLKLVDHYRNETTEFFSKKTGLQKGFSGKQESPFGAVETTSVITDYKKFGDLVQPSRISQKMSGMEQIMTIDEMEYDNVDEKLFALPAAVEALLKK